MSQHIVVINDLSEPMGGASQLAVRSAIAFAERGHRVTYITGDGGSEALRGADIEIVALSQDRLLAAGFAKSALRGIYNPAARRMLEHWIERNDHPGAVYHLHGWSQILSPSIFKPLQKIADRLVLSAHDFFVTCPNGAMFDFKRQETCKLKPLSLQCVTRPCDRRSNLQKVWRVARHAVLAQMRPGFDKFPPLLLIHKGMAPLLAQAGVEHTDMAVLPNPVTPFCAQPVKAEENRTALFVGRVEKTKGIDLAAEACRRAGIKLVAVGTGSLLDEMRHAYPEHDWVGWTPANEIHKYASQARMLLMPSVVIEPFGLTAVEGLWSGLPVICSDNALLADQIAELGAGTGINPHDLEQFAQVLSDWARDDEMVRQMSRAAHEKTRGLAMLWDDWIARLLDSYEALRTNGKQGLLALYRGSDPAIVELRLSAHSHRSTTPLQAQMELSDAAG